MPLEDRGPRCRGPSAHWSAYPPRLSLIPDVPAQRVRPSTPRDFHPSPLTDPDLNLSMHPARATARRLPPSIEPRVDSDVAALCEAHFAQAFQPCGPSIVVPTRRGGRRSPVWQAVALV